jgi:hypothetical protein
MIEPGQLTTVQTTFVQSDYRHVESDVVLVAPLRRAKTKRVLRRLLIYILIEHQSRPDRLMPLRSLDYTVQVFRYQVREWSKTHRSFSRIRFDPVLPVVFYTGTQRWDSPGRLVDLVDLGEQFESMIPSFEPLFINLPEIPAETLESQGGYFGSVLRLVQQRSAGPGEFEALLDQVVQHLETMPDAERLRWLELLSYIMALVYHVRDPSEQPKLRKTIESSVRTDPHRQEIHEMGRSMADVLGGRRRAQEKPGDFAPPIETAVRERTRCGECHDPGYRRSRATGRVAGPSGHRRDAGRRGHRHARLVLGRTQRPARRCAWLRRGWHPFRSPPTAGCAGGRRWPRPAWRLAGPDVPAGSTATWLRPNRPFAAQPITSRDRLIP